MPPRKPSPAARTTSAIQFLLGDGASLPQLILVVGDDDCQRRFAIEKLKQLHASASPDSAGCDRLDGSQTDWASVHDRLATRSLFGDGPPLVIVEAAESLVTAARDALVAWAERTDGPRPLVLECKSLAANSKVRTAAERLGLVIDCGTPAKPAEIATYLRHVRQWLAQRAVAIHSVQVENAALERLTDMVPASLGLLDQEIARLALLVEPGGKLTARLVEDHVGSWRTRRVWELVDAAVEGRTADALLQFDRLLSAGEKPHGVVPQMASALRQYALAASLFEAASGEGHSLGIATAVQRAGVPPFLVDKAVGRLKQLGRQRGTQLAPWLLELELAIKGPFSADAPARLAVERLLLRLAPECDPRRA